MAHQDATSRIEECREAVRAAKSRLHDPAPPTLPGSGLGFLAEHPVLTLAAAAGLAVVLGRRRGVAAIIAAGSFLMRSEVVRRHAASWILGQTLARRGTSAEP